MTKTEEVSASQATLISKYKKAALKGDVIAQFRLELVYYRGKGVSKNHARAVKWYKKAAAQGLPSAQFNVGLMYGAGKGVSKSCATAAKWYKEAGNKKNQKMKKAKS